MSQNKRIKMDTSNQPTKKKEFKIWFDQQQGMENKPSMNPQLIQGIIDDDDALRVRIVENVNEIQEQESEQFFEKIQQWQQQMQKRSAQKNSKINKNFDQKIKKDIFPQKKHKQVHNKIKAPNIIPKKQKQRHAQFLKYDKSQIQYKIKMQHQNDARMDQQLINQMMEQQGIWQQQQEVQNIPFKKQQKNIVAKKYKSDKKGQRDIFLHYESQNYQDYPYRENKRLIQFKSIIPKSKNQKQINNRIQINKTSRQIKKQGQKLMNIILMNSLEKTLKNMMQYLIIENNTTKKIQKCQKSQIMIIHIKKGQQQYLKLFYQLLKELQLSQRGLQPQITNFRLVSTYNIDTLALDIKISQQTDILNHKRQQKQKMIQQKKQKQTRQQSIYINKRIMNLNKQDLYKFDDCLDGIKYKVILASYKSLPMDFIDQKYQKSNKNYYQLYHNKNNFIRFFYYSIFSKSLMCYLPKQILKVLELYDYYPISYEQGCKMIIYALQLFENKLIQKNMVKKYVDLGGFFDIFMEVWIKLTRSISYYKQQVKITNYEEIIKCILDQNHNYSINKNIIYNLNNYFNQIELFQEQQQQYYLKNFNINLTDKNIISSNENNINQKNQLKKLTFYQKFYEQLKNRISINENLKYLVKIMQEMQSQMQKDRKIRSRNLKQRQRQKQRQNQMNKKHYLDEQQKVRFEYKINYIIKYVTKQIRNQGSLVPWNQIDIFPLLRPQLVLDTVKGVTQQQDIKQLFDTIRSRQQISLQQLKQIYNKKLSQGRLIYILLILIQKGLIQTYKTYFRSKRVMIRTSYYEKACYVERQMEQKKNNKRIKV